MFMMMIRGVICYAVPIHCPKTSEPTKRTKAKRKPVKPTKKPAPKRKQPTRKAPAKKAKVTL